MIKKLMKEYQGKTNATKTNLCLYGSRNNSCYALHSVVGKILAYSIFSVPLEQ